jgi:metal-dependent amidase/aminoacylase/carboxypeptidase family protein
MYNLRCVVRYLNDNFTGIITKGGTVANVTPHETQMFYNIRAPTACELNELTRKVKACFDGAALATGCKVRTVRSSAAKFNLVTPAFRCVITSLPGN